MVPSTFGDGASLNFEDIPPRKYFSENAVNLCTSVAAMRTPGSLYQGEDPEFEAGTAGCHIYIVARRPALSFDPQFIVHQGGIVSGHLVRKMDGNRELISFRGDFLRPLRNLEVAPYPHRYLIATDVSGKLPIAPRQGLPRLQMSRIGQSVISK